MTVEKCNKPENKRKRKKQKGELPDESGKKKKKDGTSPRSETTGPIESPKKISGTESNETKTAEKKDVIMSQKDCPEKVVDEEKNVIKKRKKKRKKKLPPLPAPDPGALEAMLVENKQNETENQPTGDDPPEIDSNSNSAKEKRKAKKMKKVKPIEIESKTETDNTNTPQLAIDYLEQWQNNRKSWSFKKVRQVWLLKNMFNKDLLPDKSFSILLDYLQNAKGAARTKTVNDAESYFKSCEDNTDNTDDIKLNRSRQLLQHLS